MSRSISSGRCRVGFSGGRGRVGFSGGALWPLNNWIMCCV